MGYSKVYGELLEAIVKEADIIAMRYFRSAEMRVERKYDGSAVTQGDKAVEEMARAKVAASGIALDVLGEEMGGDSAQAPAKNGRARMIIDPIDGTEEFSRGIPTFGTLLGIEENGEIVGDGERACAVAGNPLVGVSRRRSISQWQAHPRFTGSKVERSDGVYDRNGTQQRPEGSRSDSPPGGFRAQQPFHGRLLATHAGSGRVGGSRD